MRAESAPRVCRDLRAKGFSVSPLNGIWKLGGSRNGRPFYFKGLSRVAITVDASGAAPRARAVLATAEAAPGSTAPTAANALLLLHYNGNGLWAVAPNMQQRPAGAAAAAAAGSREDFDVVAVAVAASDAADAPSGTWTIRREADNHTVRGTRGDTHKKEERDNRNSDTKAAKNTDAAKKAETAINIVKFECLTIL